MEQSVHLQKFPELNDLHVNNNIVNKMDKVREICNCVFSLRKEENIRVRMPLKKITICGDIDLEDDYLILIKQEVNTKEIEIFNGNLEEIANKDVILNMKECGKLFGSKLKDILNAQKQKQWEIVNGTLKIAGCEIESNLFEVVYKSKENTKMISCQSFNILVMIDTEQSKDLIIEGLMRDFVRIIQQQRKDNGYEISDRINIVIYTEDEVFNDILENWKEYICEQTLCKSISIQKQNNSNHDVKEIDGHFFSVNLSKF